jgi:hypothetical protein
MLEDRRLALHLAHAVEQPVALDLEHLRHQVELGQVGIGRSPAHDVVDEGAVDAGDLADLRGIEAELLAAGLEAVGHRVAHGWLSTIVDHEDEKGLIRP